ncbi:hypothetical protein [Bacillus sp. SA1-12]|uniref:hypothetical protein n=1 Tax=Bacillus sp. SA1-12 TaxID=1455638 RepID=UPI000697613F|nr:hypothetical protein [Bacillus sp. SA1-12]
MNIKVPVVNFVELKVKHQFLDAYPLMKQLYPDLTLSEYPTFLNRLIKDGYQVFALYHDTTIVVIAIIEWREDLYIQRHVFVQSIKTNVNHHPSGLGYSLLNYINNWAKDLGADFITLES